MFLVVSKVLRNIRHRAYSHCVDYVVDGLRHCFHSVVDGVRHYKSVRRHASARPEGRYDHDSTEAGL